MENVMKNAWSLFKKGGKEMEKLGKNDTKTLTKEIKYGEKFTAKVTGTAFYYNETTIMPKFCLTTKVEIYDNKTGKIVGKAYHASRISSDTDYDRWNMEGWIKKGLPFDLSESYTRVDRVFCKGDETYYEISDSLEAMKQELHEAFGKEYTNQREESKKEEIDNAKKTIELAKKQGLDKIMTNAELKIWRRNYNNLHNEGGEGFIPSRVSLEQYNKALEIIK